MAKLIGADGLEVRDSGPWAREKLTHLDRFMNMVTTAMPKHFDRLEFLDLMAGPGRCEDRSDDSEFPGSPILALNTKKPWNRVHLVERDDDLRSALTLRIAKEPRASTAAIIAGDSNDPRIIQQLRDATYGRRVLGLAFIDLIGQEIAFDTIRALSDARKIDLWFSFPEMDLKRNATLAPRDDDQAARWTRFFGTDAWRPITLDRRPRHALIGLLRLYRQQLESLGYKTDVSALPMKNSRGATMYRPLFASRDDRGVDFFRKSLLKSGVERPATLFDLR